MSDDRATALFFEMFSGLPRQGPGDAASTRRALALVPALGAESRVLDVGCGTGLQTRVLAQSSPARILAVDNHAPFVEELSRQAAALGLAGRLEARVGDMTSLGLHPGSLDLIWCEGAVYVMGLAAALRAWRPLLAPGGHVALTEVCWARSDPPRECVAFWQQEYPAIRDVAAHRVVIEECGYDLVGHFPLPPAAWWDDYYRPLQDNVTAFRDRHAGEVDAVALADQVQREIDMWHAYAQFYGYEFFVMRAR
jgi:SAM-dependent methyltransferase